MKSDNLKQFVAIRESLVQEKSRIEERLSQINQALGSAEGAVSSSGRKGPGHSGNGISGYAADRAGGSRAKKWVMSEEAKAKIAAAARRRWAKAKSQGKNHL